MEDFDMDSKESNNFLKCVIAQSVLRGGLQQFVNDELQKVRSQLGLSCGCCKSQDVAEGCACPRCVGVMKNIKSMHFYGKPTLNNISNIFRINNPLEIGQLFLPTEGYRHLLAFDEIDLNGLINILLNCLHFRKCFTFTPQPSGTNCLLSKLRHIGRTARHTSTYKVSDPEFHDTLKTMITLLSDKKQLSRDQHAMEAVRKLNKLQTDQISMYQVEAVKKWKQLFDERSSDDIVKGTNTDKWRILEDLLCDKSSSLGFFSELMLREQLLVLYVKKKIRPCFIPVELDDIFTAIKADKAIDLENDPKDTLRVADQMALKWAFPHWNGTTSVDSRSLSKYKYLFRVSLKNSDQHDILQLINEQFVSVTYVEQDRENAIRYIRQALEKEMCCVVVDGTAEWKKRNVNVPLPCLPSSWESTLVRVQ